MHVHASTPVEIDQLLIAQLHRAPGGISAADLADRLGCTAERITCHLRRLEREHNARSRSVGEETRWTAP